MLIAGKEYENRFQFYKSREWRKKRAEVLRHDRNECQMCKAEGRYSKATTVHHVNHVDKRPDLALTYMHGGKRNLISLCKTCHNKVHPEKRQHIKKKIPLTPERW